MARTPAEAGASRRPTLTSRREIPVIAGMTEMLSWVSLDGRMQ
jgi:hypothetical protein